MNPLHTHDILSTLKEAVPVPLGLESGSSGSDPITHKKMREEVNKPPAGASSPSTKETTEVQPTSSAESSTEKSSGSSYSEK